MARTTAPITVDEASARLLDVEHQVVAGIADAVDLAAAKRALREARQFAAETAEEQEGLDAIRTRHETIAAIEAQIAHLEGDELRARLEEYEQRYTAALEALAAERAAWGELTASFHGSMRAVRRLASSGHVPEGVEVTALTGFDVEVVTPSGVWNSAAGLREDPPRYLLEGAPVVARGGQPRSDLLVRLRRWHQRGVGGVGAAAPTPIPGAASDGEGAT